MVGRNEKEKIESGLQQARRKLYGERIGYRGVNGVYYGGSGSVHFLRTAEIQPMRVRITPAPTGFPTISSAPTDVPR